MDETIVYREKIFSKGFFILSSIITIFILLVFIYEQNKDNFFIITSFIIVFLLVGLTILFSQLTIIISKKYIYVGYGFVKKQILLNKIQNCYLDDASAIVYLGFGIRLASYKGKSRLVYNVMNTPRVVLSMKNWKYDEFVFSTKNPEKIMKTIKSQIVTKK